MAPVSGGPLPETCCPPATVWLWAGHAVYRGPSLRLDAHCGSVHCLAIGVDAPFTLSAEGLGEVRVRSALIPPRTIHRVVAHGDQMLFCYIDSGSPRAHHCWERMTDRSHGFGLGHRAEAAVIDLAGRADLDPTTVLDLVCGPLTRHSDPRISVATATLQAHPGRSVTAADLAAAAHLSTSRFLHLFSEHAGTSFRRYRLWARMLSVGRAIAKGVDLTTASADAGFASPSHFSDAFHAMTGLTATTLLGSGATVVVLD